MSISIKSLPKAAFGKCRLCTSHITLLFWDTDLGGRICQDCEPHLTSAEETLTALKCSHPNELLVFRNP
jgi:hypothetical protein